MESFNFRNYRVVALVTGLTALGACADFNQEAGISLDTGTFGNATMNNTLIQTGEQDYTIALATRFAEEVPNMVNFEFNSSVLDAGAQGILREQANWIKQFPEVRFRVYGHTDAVGSNSYNKALGLRRAQAAVAYLISQGISRSRLEAVASFGKTQPLVPTNEPERRNRRTVTEVSGFVQSHKSVLDGKYAQIIYRDYIVSARSETLLKGVDDAASGTSE